MKRKVNPAAGRDGSGVGLATADSWWSHPDLKPLPTAVKVGHRYLAHTRFDGVDLEAPDTEQWKRQSVTVEVIATGQGWIDERTWTYNFCTLGYEAEQQWPVRPRGPGWEFEAHVEPGSSSWLRRRAVSR